MIHRLIFFVNINVDDPSEEFKDCCRLFKEQIIVSLSSCDSSIDWPTFHLFASSELHISLSRTVPIQYHLIEPLIADIRAQLLKKSRCIYLHTCD